MSLDVEIMNKPKKNIKDDIKVKSSSDVIEIKDVQAIRNAIKEHLLFIGLDNGNNIRNISILGIGTSCEVIIDTKDIIRTALFSASDKVILVHNHPSNSLEPSKADLHLTNITNQILKAFNIKLLDHIIVTEKEYMSMDKIQKISKEYGYKSIDNMQKGFLIEENERLKKQIEDLQKAINEKNSIQDDYTEYEDNVEEIITNISDLDDKHYFTVARVIENGKCVELHYDNGEATIEFDTKEEDRWNSQCLLDANWFNLNMTEQEILEHLNKEYENYFGEKEKDLL